MRLFVIGLLGLVGTGVAVGIPWLLFHAWKILRSGTNDLGGLRGALASVSVIAIGIAYLSLAVPTAAGALYRTIGVSPPIQLGGLLWHGLPLMWLGLAGAGFGLCATGFVRIGLVASAGALVILGLGFAAMR
jgi:hypothetical protein